MAFDELVGPLDQTAPAEPRWRHLTFGRVFRQFVLVCAAILAIYPVWFMISTAFKSNDQYLENTYGFPWPLDFANFSDALRGGEFFRWLANSAIFSFGSVILATLFGALAAFAIARMRFRGRDAFLSINVALLIVPPVVMLASPVHALHAVLVVSTMAIILDAGLTLPFSVYLLSNFFRAIPRELFESAAMDGASHFKIFSRILMPLSAPALVTLVVVNALWVWNELLIALVFLPDEDKRTLMVGVTVFQGATPSTSAHDGRHVPRLDPDVPPLPLRPAALLRGLTAGAVKG